MKLYANDILLLVLTRYFTLPVKKIIVAIVILYSILLSCKKDIVIEDKSNSTKQFDTLKPLPYFPVYPNSYWKYLTTSRTYTYDDAKKVYVVTHIDSVIVIDTTSSKYILNSYVKYYQNNIHPVISDTTYVPFFNNKPIYHYSILDKIYSGAPEPYYEKYKFFSDIIGDTFPTSHNAGHLTYTGLCLKVISKYSTNGVDSIVNLRGSYYGNSHFYETEKFLYKKNVGLILHAKYSPILKDTFYRKELIDYKISYK